jgi:hypothetical protein
VLDSLRAHERDHPGAGPHPRTADWETAYGRAIPGSTCAEQLAAVQRWDQAARRDQQQLRIIQLGTHAHSAIEQAVGARISDPDWDERLTEALTDFPGCTWPLEQFTPPPGEGSS